MLISNANHGSNLDDSIKLPVFPSEQPDFVKVFDADQYFALNPVPAEQNPSPVDDKSTKSWFGKACTYVKSKLTTDNLSKISMVATAALAASLLLTKGNSEFDRGVEEAGREFSTFYFMMACAYLVNNQFSKAAKKLAIAVALTHLVNHKINRYELNEYKQLGTSNDFARSQNDVKTLSSVNERLNVKIRDLNLELETTSEELNKKLGACKYKLNTKEKYLDFLLSEAVPADRKVCEESFERYEQKITDLKKRLEDALNQIPDEKPPVYSSFEYIKSFLPFGTPQKTNRLMDPKVKILPMQITFGTTYIAGNPQRDALSEMVAKTHEEYAKRWNLVYNPVTENLLVGKCQSTHYSYDLVDCVPYWNKIAVLQNCLNKPQIHDEEWCVIIDDDMPVTNMKVDPREAINLLRRGVDSSVIVARDVSVWNGDPKTAVNTGALFVRKDNKGKEVVNRIWEKRNDKGSGSDVCKTLGTCKNQETLHEQKAMADLLKENLYLLNGIVTVVMPRDSYEGREIALNTFERSGCFRRQQEHWGSASIDYKKSDQDYPEGAWREGDWMGQTAGVPIVGWYCDDYNNGKTPGPLRADKLKIMIGKTVK